MAVTKKNEVRLFYRLALLLIGTTLFTLSSVAARAFCGSFTFGSLSYEDRKRDVERALARVYAPDATNSDNHLGAATVVHINPTLLVTASHVVESNDAKISFSKLSNQLYSARVIARSNGKPLGTEASLVPENQDFAVLLVEHPPSAGLAALETWFDDLSDRPHDLVGYARDMPTPLWGTNGTLALNTECAWRMRDTTFNGDSGGAVVSQDGLIVGVIIDGREGGQFNGGAMGQATVLPLSCVRNTILSALEQADPIAKPNVLDADRNTLMHELQPPPSTGWIGNLDFAKGIRGLIADRTLYKKLDAQKAIECPLIRSAFERKLGFDIAIQLAKLAENAKEVGDRLKSMADDQKDENAELAKRLYASAAASYGEYVNTRKGNPGVSPPPDIAQAALGRADALASLATIVDDSSAKTAAVAAAAHAVQATSKTPSKGLAYAILGSSAFEAGDYQTAIEAYSSASKNGFNPEWVKKDYLEAFKRRDNVLEASAAKGFTTLGAYPALSDKKLEFLGMIVR